MHPLDSTNFLQLHKRNSANSFDCNADIYMYFLRCLRKKNHFTPSNLAEIRTDVNKILKWCGNRTR